MRFVLMVWRTCLGICCRDTGKVEFWEVLNDTWKEVVARVASSWNSSLQTDAAVNIHLNLQLSCEQFKTNCYLRCTQSDPMNVCPSPPSDGWVWAEFSWALPCAWPPGPTGCQQWGHRGLEQQLFLKQWENKAWILQRGKVHVSFSV